jgi:hypothetical protein
MSNGSATTITVNTGLFAAGDIVTIINLGAGVCTITAGTATVTTSGSLALAQNQGGVLRFTSASAAIFFQFATPASGDIEGVTAGTGISGGGTSGTVTITNSMATEITAKGDLIVGTGNATFDNLPVGTNGYTLVADSAETTGLKWAAPASGLTTTLIASGSLSGASLTLSSLSTYDEITVLFNLVGFSTNGQFRCRINNNSTSNYHGRGFAQVGSSSDQNNYLATAGILSFDSCASSGFAAGQNNFAFTFTNCKNAGFTNFQYTGAFINGSNTRTIELISGGVYAVAEAVSSLVFVNTGGNFSAGSYRIYGG